MKFLLKLIRFIYRPIKLYFLNKKVTDGRGKIICLDPFFKIKIKLGHNSKLILNGDLTFLTHLEGNLLSYINISDNATMIIDGPFTIGNGVRIHLQQDSILHIGGADKEDLSGITENSKIMVYNSIKIGKDFLCAWDVFITDSDWHSLTHNNVLQKHHGPVIIGDKVWITSGCKILKGTEIGNGSIVGSSSVLSNTKYLKSSIIKGNPAVGKVKNISWSRKI